MKRTRIKQYEENGYIITVDKVELDNGIVATATNKHPILTDEQKAMKEKSIARMYLNIKNNMQEKKRA